MFTAEPPDNRGLHVQPETAAGGHAETKCLLAGVAVQQTTLQGQILALLRELHNYSIRFEMTSLHSLLIIILTFNCQTHSERGCAVALLHTGVIPLVFQAEARKLQVGLPFLGEELLAAVL